MESKTIEMAALGRALHPGSLYDCRSDSLIPGISLWDNETIKMGLDSRRQPKTDVGFTASDSLNEKAKLLDLSASLKASFLAGLVKVGGSARYMRDNKSSARQSRVSLKYSQTTKFEQLTMDQLGNITYPQVFDDGAATHVVTAVLYGAQAFMVFDLTANENEDKEEIEGNLNVMVKNIPSLSIAGEGAVTMSETERKLADTINCTFYGDYELEQNPTTYMEALQVYRTLPSLLRNQENDAVPMKVWLYPLARLSKKAATLEREIHKTRIIKTETLLEELGNAETQCNDLITNTTINDFKDVKLRLKRFQELLDVYKVKFLKALRTLIPAIRAGQKQEMALAEILAIHQKSPFSAEKLNQWLAYRQGEINLLNLYTQQLNGVPVVQYLALMNNILFNPNVDTVVCFCFTSLMDEDPYLSILTAFLKVDEFEELSAIPVSADQDIKVWFHNPEVIGNLKDKLFLFKGFFHANKDERKTKFVIVSVSDSSNPGISIRLYKKGKIIDSTFQPVSKPPAPMVDIQDQNIMLTLQTSPTGSTVRFRVEYRIIQATDSEAVVEKWEVKETPDAQENFTLTGLQLKKQYRIRYRAVSEFGMSEASDSVLFSAHGKYKLSFSERWNWLPYSFINEIRHKVRSSLGPSQWTASTIKPVVKNLVNNPEIPYELEISEMKSIGTAFHFQGVVPADSDSFDFTFKTGKGKDDFVFSLKIHPEVASYMQLISDRHLHSNVRGCPLLKGSAFDMFLVLGNEGYVVYYNGLRSCMLQDKIRMERVTTLNIDGNVTVNSIGVVSDWSKSAFGNHSGTSRWELSKNQSDGPQPVSKPNQPYLGQIPGGLKIGLAFFFQGVVPSDASGFEINYKTGPNDGDAIAYQFKPALHAVHKMFVRDVVFGKGEAIDIIIIITGDSYEVAVNGHFFTRSDHHIPVEKVSTLQICGDILMNTCAIIHVDKFNLTCDLSAHI